MKKFVFYGIPLALCLSLFLSSSAHSTEQSGEELFKTMKCSMCHDSKVKKRGPSLITIADAYPDTESMALYFSGKADPIVDPKRAKSMQPRLRKIMKLNETDQKALASFLMGFKN